MYFIYLVLFIIVAYQAPDPCANAFCAELTCANTMSLPGECCPVCVYKDVQECASGREGRKCK